VLGVDGHSLLSLGGYGNDTSNHVMVFLERPLELTGDA
jgi:hypothetical protein